MSNKIQTTVKMSKELFEKIEIARWVVRQKKNDFILTAIERYIDELEKQDVIRKYDELFSELSKDNKKVSKE